MVFHRSSWCVEISSASAAQGGKIADFATYGALLGVPQPLDNVERSRKLAVFEPHAAAMASCRVPFRRKSACEIAPAPRPRPLRSSCSAALARSVDGLARVGSSPACGSPSGWEVESCGAQTCQVTLPARDQDEHRDDHVVRAHDQPSAAPPGLDLASHFAARRRCIALPPATAGA